MEVEQSEGILRGMTAETAQRKGRALLGLRCVVGLPRYCSPRRPTHFEPSFLEVNGTL